MERLEKNFLWLFAANIVSTFFGAVLMIYIARTLEASEFGFFSVAMTVVLYLFNFVDLGLSTFGIREVAKDPGSAGVYVSNIASFRLIVAAAIFSVFSVTSLFYCHIPVLRALFIGSALMLFTSAIATEWAFQGMEKMYMVFISYLVTPAIQLVCVLSLVRGPEDAVKVPPILFLSSLPVAVIYLRKLGFRMLVSRVDFSRIGRYLSSSIVIWAISLFAQAYNNLDIVLLGFFRPPSDVGSFTVARRIIGGIAILMILLANAVLPRLSCTFTNDIAQFRSATRKFLRISILIMLTVFLPIFVFSKEILSLTVGQGYVFAALPLKIMVLALVLILFNLPFSTGLIAACYERDVLKQAAASAALSLILNLVLMPKYGMIGGAISFFFAEALALVWILTLYHKRIRIVRSAL